MLHVVVDGANVVGSRPDGWWRDRAGAAARLAGRLDAVLCADPGGLTAAFARSTAGVATDGSSADGPSAADGGSPAAGDSSADAESPAAPHSPAIGDPVTVVLVLEGAARAAESTPASPALQIVRAEHDGDSAIAALTVSLAGAGQDVVVVTADRGLRARVHAAGGRTAGPSALLRVLDHPDR